MWGVGVWRLGHWLLGLPILIPEVFHHTHERAYFYKGVIILSHYAAHADSLTAEPLGCGDYRCVLTLLLIFFQVRVFYHLF